MPRVSKRTKKAETQPQIKYYRTYIYLRLSEKDGGHGRRDSIYIQKQICVDFAKKHPEMLIMKVYTDNGVTGTTFERKAFEELMTDVRAGKVDCIIVKDFSRFGMIVRCEFHLILQSTTYCLEYTFFIYIFQALRFISDFCGRTPITHPFLFSIASGSGTFHSFSTASTINSSKKRSICGTLTCYTRSPYLQVIFPSFF